MKILNKKGRVMLHLTLWCVILVFTLKTECDFLGTGSDLEDCPADKTCGTWAYFCNGDDIEAMCADDFYECTMSCDYVCEQTGEIYTGVCDAYQTKDYLTDAINDTCFCEPETIQTNGDGDE